MRTSAGVIFSVTLIKDDFFPHLLDDDHMAFACGSLQISKNNDETNQVK